MKHTTSAWTDSVHFPPLHCILVTILFFCRALGLGPRVKARRSPWVHTALLSNVFRWEPGIVCANHADFFGKFYLLPFLTSFFSNLKSNSSRKHLNQMFLEINPSPQK